MPCSSLCCSQKNFFVYCSHFLSAWGDRMWAFGIGIFLIYISPESLQLTAIYGLCRGIAVLVFGAFIGDIVDNTPRLRAAQVALLLQNLFVVINAVVICLFLMYKEDVESLGEWTRYVLYVLVIALSTLSLLTSVARKIAVEKDWIVEMCQGNSDNLATMTATLRRIDLITQILAPAVTGLIMAFAGVQFGALFIGGWNLVSVIVEYYLLWKVYNTVPALRKKKDFIKAKDVYEENDLDVEVNLKNDQEKIMQNCPENETERKETDCPGTAVDETKTTKPEKRGKITSRCSKLLTSGKRLYKGWPIYAKYQVAHAGLGLAFLYMTVLGFDNITVGYAKLQGISDGLLGLAQGLAACFGILGTVLYPIMRRRLGLVRTGLFGISFELIALVSCIVSVWLPGSPFDMSKGFGPPPFEDSMMMSNCSQNLNATDTNITAGFVSKPSPTTDSSTECTETLSHSLISVWVFVAGIIVARTGLWIADLAITQLFLEEVEEQERGKVNGVQTSLNQLMDLLKFVMVVFAPYEHQFGMMVLISYGFVSIGWSFYAYYLRKVQGHLLPHCTAGNGHVPEHQSNDPNTADNNADMTESQLIDQNAANTKA